MTLKKYEDLTWKKKDTYFLLKSSLDLGDTADVANSILEYSVLIAAFALLHSYFD